MFSGKVSKLFILSLLSFFVHSAVLAKTRSVANTTKLQKSARHMKLIYPMLLVNQANSRWDLLKKMRRHLPAKKFSAIKMVGDRSKVLFYEPLRLKLFQNGKVLLTNHKKSLTLGKNGKSLSLRSKQFSINPDNDPLQNYQIILGQLKAEKSVSLSPWWIPHAMAEILFQESLAYDVLTLLYFNEIYMASDGKIMEDFFLDEPEVQQIIGRLKHKNLRLLSGICG